MDTKSAEQENQWFEELNVLDRMVNDLERVGWSHKEMYKVLRNERDDLKRKVFSYKEQQSRAEKYSIPLGERYPPAHKSHIEYWKDRLNTRVIIQAGSGIFKNFTYNQQSDFITGMLIKMDEGYMVEYPFYKVRSEEFQDRLRQFLLAEKVDERFNIPLDDVVLFVDSAIMIGAGVSLASREYHLKMSSGGTKKFHDNCNTGNGSLSSVGQSGSNSNHEYPPYITDGCSAGAYSKLNVKSKEDA